MNQLHEVFLPGFMLPFIQHTDSFDFQEVVSLSGRRVTNYNQDAYRRHYHIKDCLLTNEEFMIFNNFFKCRRGGYFHFLYRDPLDYEATNQIIAYGDDISLEFPLYKTYDDDIAPFRHRITRPIGSSLKFFIDEEEIAPEFSFEKATLRLPEPLASGQVLSANFKFDIIIRFACNKLEYSHKADGSISLSDIQLVEVLL